MYTTVVVTQRRTRIISKKKSESLNIDFCSLTFFLIHTRNFLTIELCRVIFRIWLLLNVTKHVISHLFDVIIHDDGHHLQTMDFYSDTQTFFLHYFSYFNSPSTELREHMLDCLYRQV